MNPPGRSPLLLAAAATLLLASAIAHAHGNDFEMIFGLTRELAKRPNDPGLLLERAEVYRAHGDLPTARRDLESALAAHPALQPARVRLALVARDEGHLQESLGLLQAVIEAQPTQPLARSVRAEILRSLGRHAEAVTDLDAILATPGVEPVPQLYLDKARAQLASPKPDTNAIVAGLDQGIARLGPVTSLHLLALDLEEASGLVDAALRRLDAIAKDAPRKERWLERRGDLLQRSGRTDEARKAWSEAIAASGFVAEESDTPVLWDRDGDFLAWLGPRSTPHFVLLDRELRVITRDYFEEVGVRGLDVLASVVAGAPDVIQPAR